MDLLDEMENKAVTSMLGNSSNPLIARAYAYIGLPTLSNYTIEADLLGTQVRNDLPMV